MLNDFVFHIQGKLLFFLRNSEPSDLLSPWSLLIAHTSLPAGTGDGVAAGAPAGGAQTQTHSQGLHFLALSLSGPHIMCVGL